MHSIAYYPYQFSNCILVYDVPLARQKLSLVNEACDAIHLDQILDILLQIETLLRNLELPVAV